MAYKDNTSNLQKLQDFGIKIAKVGYDATTAADKDMMFNSSWPSIQIVKVIQFDGTIFKFPHGLTFPPFSILFRPNALYYEFAMEGLACDEINVYVPSTYSGSATIVIYNIDLTADVEYPYTTKDSYQNIFDYDFGLKMGKDGKDIDSADMRDYILHSRCGSPLVLAVKTQDTSNPANPTIVQYTNKIGYPTLNFGFIRVIGTSFIGVSYDGIKRYYNAPLQSQAYPWTVTDGFITYVSFGATSDGATIVILRNPSIATTNSVMVNY